MLKPKAFTELLGQANTGGILNTMLLNNEGSVLAYSGHTEVDSRVTAAIASNIWTEYEQNGKYNLDDDELELVLIKCEVGNVAIAKVANLLLCIYAKNTTPLGILKLKFPMLRNLKFSKDTPIFLLETWETALPIETLSKFLEKPLSEVALS